jgi:uncharacterized protein YaiL (DUF2058 family)
MRTPLQEQLLKAGLVKKGKLAEVVREQNRQRHAKGQVPAAGQVDARKLQAERAERDRALAAERNAQARAAEKLAQVRQIVEAHRVSPDGDVEYRFTDGDRIRSVLVDAIQRTQLAKGLLAIARHHDGYALVPRAAADRIHEREPGMVVLDHGRRGNETRGGDSGEGDDDEYYRRFPVPDDLVW